MFNVTKPKAHSVRASPPSLCHAELSGFQPRTKHLIILSVHFTYLSVRSLILSISSPLRTFSMETNSWYGKKGLPLNYSKGKTCIYFYLDGILFYCGLSFFKKEDGIGIPFTYSLSLS